MNGTYTQRRTTQRQNYGLGDLVKKVGERFRKLIPNEIANVAAKAAPFVAPFNPLAAGIMRGVGRYDKRGDFGDALKQGALTYGFGKAAGYGLSQIPTGSATAPNIGTMRGAGPLHGISTVDKALAIAGGGGGTEKASIFKKAMDFAKAPFKALGEMDKGKAMLTVGAIGTGASYVIDKLVGPKDPGETMQEYMTRRKSTMSEYLRYYYKNVNPLASEDEVANFVATNTREYSSQGGRIGYKYGSGIKSLDAGAPSITYEGDMKMASGPYEGTAADADEHSYRMFGKPYGALNEIELEEFNLEMERLQSKFGAAEGGRVRRYAGGMGLPTIPGAPRMAPDGLEYDMSQNGGFQPLGAQEGKDDVKANLAKNEFVFTADAVRGAGDGDIETGAQRMYDTMKRLEGRVA